MTEMTLVMGLPNDPPLMAVAQALAAINAPHAVIDQRRLLQGSLQTWWNEGGAGGVMDVDGQQIPLDAVTGVYTRLTAWSTLPEVVANPARLARAHEMYLAIENWLETTSARVLNRTSANDTNNSKPYQSLIIRDHFHVPATLVTNDPAALAAFRSEFDQIIYKSVSGERSIVTLFSDGDAERLHLLASAPVQFQEYVSGVDVRVHVVGEQVFATCVESTAVDYRYDHSGAMSMSAVDLADAVAAECVRLSRRLGLGLSGIDLRYCEDGRIVCFEVNPSPAYSVYEDATEQPIADAIARYLSQAV